MKLVIDGYFLAKKNENLKFFCKTYVIYIKRKLRTCRIQIQEEKVWFMLKKDKKKFFFRFFWNFQLFVWKMSQGVLGNVKRNKVMKYELIWSVLRGVTDDHLRVRAHCVPPCSIGLKDWNYRHTVITRCIVALETWSPSKGSRDYLSNLWSANLKDSRSKKT